MTPMHAPEDITAIVVSHDSAQVLPDCLMALMGQGAGVIVVDNASADASTDIALSLGARLLRNNANEGYGRANNRGIFEAQTPLVLITNPDLVLQQGAVKALLAAAERWPDAAMFAPRIVEPSGRVFFQPRSLLSPAFLNQAKAASLPTGDACAPFLSGACLLVRREVFLRLGGFDPEIFLFYEDDDLCRRMRDAGQALVHVDGALAHHGRGKSAGPGQGRIFTARWHMAWSRAYISRKYGLPTGAFGAWFENAVKTMLCLMTLNRNLIERAAGSAAGSLAWLRGRTALQRQGLGPQELVFQAGQPPSVQRRTTRT
jgi:N-acetylglucosaminyl-diphospho-decaprenol L-rhamnosyltransferase